MAEKRLPSPSDYGSTPADGSTPAKRYNQDPTAPAPEKRGASDSMGQEPMRKILRKGDDLDDDE